MAAGSAKWFRGYPVARRRVEVAGRVVEILGPANYESLIDDPRVVARFEEDEYMPYWAEFWPASLLLADEVGHWPSVENRAEAPTVLELGCGLGLVGLVASRLGYRVTVSDYDDDALAFVAETARWNGWAVPDTRHVDWREDYADLRVDRLVAAEILYETRSLRPVADFVRNHLNPEGFALICDSNRSTADTFEQIARHCGLVVEIRSVERPEADSGRVVRGRIFRLERQGNLA